MADYRRAHHYRVFHYATGSKSGFSDIIVSLDGGGYYRYEKLPPDRAHHIIDLIRNEDTVWVERESGLLQVAYEPIGEGEIP